MCLTRLAGIRRCCPPEPRQQAPAPLKLAPIPVIRMRGKSVATLGTAGGACCAGTASGCAERRKLAVEKPALRIKPQKFLVEFFLFLSKLRHFLFQRCT